jgi:hypothetical protein
MVRARTRGALRSEQEILDAIRRGGLALRVQCGETVSASLFDLRRSISTRPARSRRISPLFAIGTSLAVACAPARDPAVDDVRAPSDAIVSDEGAEIELELGCRTPCGPGTFCSASGVCIADGTCTDDRDCPSAHLCDPASKRCRPGSECGSVSARPTLIQPDLLLVVDRSCSMRQAAGSDTKWSLAVSAVSDLVTSFAGRFRFGLELFPDNEGDACGQTTVHVRPASGTEGEIRDLLTRSLDRADALYPKGPCVTNIDTAITRAAAEPALSRVDRPHAVVLLTDGAQSPNCASAGGNAGTISAIEALRARGIPTFVIGFVGATAVDLPSLDAFAEAGGAPAAAVSPKYYVAGGGADLVKALGEVAARAQSCRVRLDDTPPDPASVHAFFDGELVPRDPSRTNGWEYDAMTNTVSFFGPACDRVRQTPQPAIDVVLGCPRLPPR